VKPFDPLGAFECLIRHKVDFILIGGIAARLWGSPTVTGDLDVCHSTSAGNLARLTQALIAMEARLRGAEEVAFPLSERFLSASDNFTFTTAFGALDCLAHPAGIGGFAELASRAKPMNLDGMQILVASVADLMLMKRASGRPKDLIELEVLGALQDELDAGAQA
jgi:hypothetical protein